MATPLFTSDHSGSWSYDGNEVSLINANESEKSVILHEFGHTLGLMHEHQSVRGGTVTSKESGTYSCQNYIIVAPDTSSAIEFCMKTQDWTEQNKSSL